MTHAQFTQLQSARDSASIEIFDRALKIGEIEKETLKPELYDFHNPSKAFLWSIIRLAATTAVVAYSAPRRFFSHGGGYASIALLAIAAFSYLAYQAYKYKSSVTSTPAWFQNESERSLAFIEASSSDISHAWHYATVPQKELEIGLLFRNRLIEVYPNLFTMAMRRLGEVPAAAEIINGLNPFEAHRPITNAINELANEQRRRAIDDIKQFHTQRIAAIYQEAQRALS